jgi:hypothetical protein
MTGPAVIGMVVKTPRPCDAHHDRERYQRSSEPDVRIDPLLLNRRRARPCSILEPPTVYIIVEFAECRLLKRQTRLPRLVRVERCFRVCNHVIVLDFEPRVVSHRSVGID